MIRQTTSHPYEDVEFLSKNLLEREGRDIFWLRPSDVCACPVFCSMLSNAHYFMVESLNPGSDNFKTIACALKKRNKLPVWPVFGSTEGADFNGRLAARFYKHGEPHTFNIDDLLPFANFQNNFAAVFAYCLNSDEFWISYVEKAYVKFLGTHYELEHRSMFDLLSEMAGCIVEKLRVKYKMNDKYTAFNNVANLMKRYDSFGLAHLENQWVMFEPNARAHDDVNLFPLRYDTQPSIMDEIKMKGDTGELEPTVFDVNDLITKVDDLLFCWFPSPGMLSKTLVGTWICNKNAGGPHFEPSFYTNPQIKVAIHQDFDFESQHQILIQVELLRPFFGTVGAKLFILEEAHERNMLKRIPSRLLKPEHVILQSESTEKMSRPFVTLRLLQARDGEIYVVVPYLPEKDMCGGFRVNILSSVVVSDLEELKGCKGKDKVERCMKRSCVRL